MTDNNQVKLPLVGEVTGTFDDGRVYAKLQRDADQLVANGLVARVQELEDALQWALDAGGWRLMYYAGEPPTCIELRPTGEPGQVRRMFPKETL